MNISQSLISVVIYLNNLGS